MTQTAELGREVFQDKREFGIVFNAYYQSLCRYAALIINDKDEVEEVVQEVFVKLWEKRKQIEIGSSLKSYLYKSVYHTALNTIKHQKVKEQYTEMKASEKTTTEFESEQHAKELKKKIELAISQLPEQCRLVFCMSRFQELKYREIADILNISVKTVENQMGKALRQMRLNLSDYLSLILLLIYLLYN